MPALSNILILYHYDDMLLFIVDFGYYYITMRYKCIRCFLVLKVALQKSDVIL